MRYVSPELLEPAREVSLDGSRSKVEIMGVSFANLLEADAVEHIVSSLDIGRGGVVVTPNLDIMRKVGRDPDLARAVRQADLVLADGMPAVWASRLQGTPLRARVAFSEMIYPLSRAAASKRKRLALLGGAPGVVERAADVLASYAPGLRVVATYSPPLGFERDDEELGNLSKLLDRVKPDIVVCALGCPKQERLMARLTPDFPDTWFVGAGGTLDIVSGLREGAPPWMRRHGLEWLHRLRLEPRRLFRRYFVDDMPFALRMLATSMLKRVTTRRSRLRLDRHSTAKDASDDPETRYPTIPRSHL